MSVFVDSETLTISTVALGLTAAKVARSDFAGVFLYCEGSVRYWTSGKVPTSTEGIPLDDGKERTLSIAEATYFKAIRSGGTDAKLHVQYLKS